MTNEELEERLTRLEAKLDRVLEWTAPTPFHRFEQDLQRATENTSFDDDLKRNARILKL